MSDEKQEISKLLNRPYKYGFKTFIESETFPKGLSEDVVRAISAKKGEPDWLLQFRLKAYRRWLAMEEPAWSDNRYPRIDFQDLSYYSEPKMKEKKASLDEVDPELLRTFDKLVRSRAGGACCGVWCGHCGWQQQHGAAAAGSSNSSAAAPSSAQCAAARGAAAAQPNLACAPRGPPAPAAAHADGRQPWCRPHHSLRRPVRGAAGVFEE
jgi:hypothetical protein